MASYLGRNWKKEELLSLIGDPSQVAGATPFVLADGKAEGVKGVRVDTGGGLSFTVLPGRGMDIAEASFRGRALSFLSGTGITSPAYYDEPGDSWLRGFFAGFLTTCGITNAGHPTVDQGRPFGLHGRVSNAGAEDLAIDQEWQGEEYLIRVKGRVREVQALAGENMTLTRKLETRLGAKGFSLHDVVENRGFAEQPLLLLYHCNFGFPLLGPRARVVGPIRGVVPRDEQARAERGVEEALVFPAPIPDYQEKVFFLELAADRQERTFVGLLNPDVGRRNAVGPGDALRPPGAARLHRVEESAARVLRAGPGARERDAPGPRRAARARGAAPAGRAVQLHHEDRLPGAGYRGGAAGPGARG